MKFKIVISLVCAFALFVSGVCIGRMLHMGHSRLKVISADYRGKILYDTKTGVEYWMSNIQANFLTVLVDKEGKPLIYDKEGEYD